jgi:hypothetical protein
MYLKAMYGTADLAALQALKALEAFQKARAEKGVSPAEELTARARDAALYAGDIAKEFGGELGPPVDNLPRGVRRVTTNFKKAVGEHMAVQWALQDCDSYITEHEFEGAAELRERAAFLAEAHERITEEFTGRY